MGRSEELRPGDRVSMTQDETGGPYLARDDESPLAVVEWVDHDYGVAEVRYLSPEGSPGTRVTEPVKRRPRED